MVSWTIVSGGEVRWLYHCGSPWVERPLPHCKKKWKERGRVQDPLPGTSPVISLPLKGSTNSWQHQASYIHAFGRSLSEINGSNGLCSAHTVYISSTNIHSNPMMNACCSESLTLPPSLSLVLLSSKDMWTELSGDRLLWSKLFLKERFNKEV